MTTLLRPPSAAERPSPQWRTAILVFLAVWLSFQVLFPLRHLLYPGSPHWTEEGHRFAWQMKLRDKKSRTLFWVTDPQTGQQWRVKPRDFLKRHQAGKVGTRPDMILQYAHYLEQLWRQRGVADAEVRVHNCVSLNGRPSQLMIDPNVDLTQINRSLRHAEWIMPQTLPFQRPVKRTRRHDLRC